ncbi:triacylglycerol lipase V precursor [Colletotrichum asianum]
MQQLSNASSAYTDYVPEFLINGGQSEDCLYINIYAPLNPIAERLPVFIYIPGGGFTGGGADSLYKIPDQWIQKTQGHIFVIMNYRVNIFGFPNAKSAPQNAGLLDQRLVVEWARDNIAAFSGDPDKITLWDMELQCMQNLDARVIQDTLSFGGTGLGFRPVVDNMTAFANSSQRLLEGRFADVPYMTGSNANEGASLGSYDPNGMLPGQYENGLKSINCPVSQEVANRDLAGLITNYYEYAGNFSNISPVPWLGAMHSAELPIIFGTHFLYRGNSTEFEWQVAGAMQDLWLSFATDPSKDPTDGNGFRWPKYTATEESMVLFAEKDTVAQLQSGSILANQCSALS